MKKYFIPLIFIAALTTNLTAQNPLVKQWDYRFGGFSADEFCVVHETSNCGFLLGGYSVSGIGGDKTQPSWGNSDYWIVKIDSIGLLEWDKRFGGTGSDGLYSFYNTIDDGYLLGGWSRSDSSGDKTQSSWSGSDDYWIIKIDSIGIKQWDKRFGGIDGDVLRSIVQTTDKGFILGGFSYSGLSGDKTQTSRGSSDYWLVKIDSIGNKQWDKRFGGSADDFLRILQQTTDDGYILGGFSYSGISGDKTQPSWGDCDYWIVKIDSSGIKQWDARFGGFNNEYLNSIIQTVDGGFLLGGVSSSPISGDKTESSWGLNDYWIVKVDSNGNKQWDKRYGGAADEDDLYNISLTNDGGYIMAGTSYSSISGNKSENNLGLEQTWIVKINTNGTFQWDKTIFTSGHDEASFIVQAEDGCFIIANTTTSGIGGYKTQPSWGGSKDYWIIKFCDTTQTTGISTNGNFQDPITIFPNPFSSIISISFPNQYTRQTSVCIKNVLGQSVFNSTKLLTPNSQPLKLDLSYLENGIYFLEITIDNERRVMKIIKD